MVTGSSADPHPPSGIRVVVVAHGPPMKGGVATVALDIVEDPQLREEFEVVFLNTSQNDDQRGSFAVENLTACRAARLGHLPPRPGRLGRAHRTRCSTRCSSPGDRWRSLRPRGCEGPGAAAQPRPAALHGATRWLPGLRGTPPRASRVLDRLVNANILIAEAGVPNIGQYMPTTELPVVYNSVVVVDDIEPTSAVHEPTRGAVRRRAARAQGVRDLLDALDILRRSWGARLGTADRRRQPAPVSTRSRTTWSS